MRITLSSYGQHKEPEEIDLDVELIEEINDLLKKDNFEPLVEGCYLNRKYYNIAYANLTMGNNSGPGVSLAYHMGQD